MFVAVLSFSVIASSFLFFSNVPQVHAEPVTLYSQPDDSGEMLSQQATFQNTWISAPIGNLFFGKDSLSITFTMKDPNASNIYGQPGGVALGTCVSCQNLQTYYFTAADRTLLADGAFHTFTVQTGTTTLGIADGETPVYITFFGLSQYNNSTHLKSNAAGTVPYLSIESASAQTPPPVPQAPPGSVTVYEQSDKTGVMTNPQTTFQNAHVDSVSLGNLNLGQGNLYMTFTMKDPNAGNIYRQPEGVALGTCVGCRDLQTYFFTDTDRTLLADQAFHTFMIETGTTTSTYADGTRPVFVSFFNLPQYQYGTKVKSNAAATIPFLIIQKLPPPDPCAVPGACASNVLFLPGIEASRLYRPDYNGGTDQLWEPNADSDVQDLFLVADGTSVRNDVYTRDVIDEKNVLPVGQGNIYKSFLNDLDKWKNTDHLITDYAAVPYDWRLSFDEILNNGNKLPDGRIYYAGSLAATSSPYIIQELRRLAKSSKTGRVTIAAHSNGGLLTKALTEKLGSTEAAKLIDKIIFIAVPQAGTPQAVGAILHGYDQGLPFDFLPLVLTPETARTLAANMPSAYNLLPSANYFTHVDDPVVEFDDSNFLAEFRARYGKTIHDGAQLKNFIADTWRLASSSPSDLKYPSVGNAALLSQSGTFHSAIDTWTPPQGVLLYEVAGWGEDTLATIEYKEGKKAYCRDMSDVRTCTVSPTITYSPREVAEGDGTVLVPSALWTVASATTAKYWVDLRKYNRSDFRTTINRKHADILEVPDLRILVKNILTNATSTPFTFIATIQPATDAADDKRLRFLLHSPLDLSATDSLGNVVSSATSTIPGGRFKRYGEVQMLSVPQNTPLTLNLDGYAPGSFTLDIEEVDGSNAVIASSTLSAIPSTVDTRATMTFIDGTLQNASPLLVDYDGNGATDFSLESVPGEEVVFDTTPPEAALSFDPASQEFKIIGTDNLSRTTVLTTATSSLITDEAGNTLQIIFKKKLKQKGKEIKVEIQELRYNGTSTGEASKTVLQYEWSIDRDGKLKELEEEAATGPETVQGHYNAKKNVTKIEEKTKGRGERGEKEKKKTLPGLVIIGLATDEGKIIARY